MSAMEVIGAGMVQGGADGTALSDLLASFKRRTQQRYVDDAVGPGLAALEGACVSGAIGSEVIDAEPSRTGLLLATDSGPVVTRGQYLETYANRGRKSVSATLFSNCGYNIVGAMLARSRNIRGPVLTFGADALWGPRLLATARRLFLSGRVNRLFVGRAEAGSAVMLALVPVADPGLARHPVILPDQATPSAVPGPEGDLLWRLAELRLAWTCA